MTLSRRRMETEHHEQWAIHDGNVRVGIVSKVNATGSRVAWQWSCWGQASGTADTLEDARAAFQKAWEKIGPTITADDREAWLFEEAFTSWKYAMWKAKCRMPMQSPEGWSHCFCGARITTAGVDDHVRAAHMRVLGVE